MIKNVRTTLIIMTFLILFSQCKKDSEVKIMYYENGKIKSIKRYNNNILQGQSQWFYENGNIEQTTIFEKGRENGNAFYFYKSGALKNFRHWTNGKMVSYATDYFDDSIGMIKSAMIFNESGFIYYKKVFDSLGNTILTEGHR